jgi:hypothetical protein
MTLTLPLKNQFSSASLLPAPAGAVQLEVFGSLVPLVVFCSAQQQRLPKTDALQLEHKPTYKLFDSD